MYKDLMDDFLRYRLMTVDVLHRNYYPIFDRDAARKAASRLVENGELSSFKIKNRVFYCLPGEKQPGAQALWERYAILNFCRNRPVRRTRILPKEFEEEFKSISKEKGVSPAHQWYYMEQDRRFLGRALIDSDAAVERVVRKVKDVFNLVAHTPGFLQLVDCGFFLISVLVVNQGKAAAVGESLKKLPSKIKTEIHVISELEHLM